jgi:hypothetical protein
MSDKKLLEAVMAKLEEIDKRIIASETTICEKIVQHAVKTPARAASRAKGGAGGSAGLPKSGPGTAVAYAKMRYLKDKDEFVKFLGLKEATMATFRDRLAKDAKYAGLSEEDKLKHEATVFHTWIIKPNDRVNNKLKAEYKLYSDREKAAGTPADSRRDAPADDEENDSDEDAPASPATKATKAAKPTANAVPAAAKAVAKGGAKAAAKPINGHAGDSADEDDDEDDV